MAHGQDARATTDFSTLQFAGAGGKVPRGAEWGSIGDLKCEMSDLKSELMTLRNRKRPPNPPPVMPMRIVLCYPVEPKHIVQIADAMPEAEIVDAGQERVAKELFAADIFCGHAKVPVDWDGVVCQGRLRWIQSSAAGMDHCLVPSVIESDIAVTSASGVLADQVAEHTIALVTAWCRSLPRFFAPSRRRSSFAAPPAT